MRLVHLLAMALCWGLALLAQSAPAQQQTERTSTATQTQILALDEARQARDWGLQDEEWARYRELMRGPLGIHSPGLDPLTALGIEARTDEERRHYAELQVQAEARRVEKLLAYQRAYDEAWQRLAPDLQRVSPVAEPVPARLAVFVSAQCPTCAQKVQRLQTAGSAFDLYLVGSGGDDARLRAWAQTAGVDPAKVRAGHITLNHDAGRWLLLGQPGELPAVLRQVAGQWRRQP
ncbi:TIGR03759 family integrating conjugative element protein [Pseudomonas sp. RL]|uniref:TIGR03759 family integrating conjugative element protein n=1 Tax=Pseudomonas sp. RL TaxID=1452718 RepID=UPI0006907E91|nr:TIGR03759 family integrating conjugative element protein [Pseudomonas sp. RL]